MTPAQVRACSIWEFEAAVEGWVAAHVPETGNKLSAQEYDDLWEAVQEQMGMGH